MSKEKKKKGWLNQLFGGKQKDTEIAHTTSEDSAVPEKVDSTNHHEPIIDNAAGSQTAIDVHNDIFDDPITEASRPQSDLDIDTSPSSNDGVISPPIQREDYPTENKTEAIIEESSKKGLFSRLRSQLSKTRENLTSGFTDLFRGKKHIDDEILEELETRLLLADVGINATEKMLNQIKENISQQSLSNIDDLFFALRKNMENILTPVEAPLIIDDSKRPFVILMIGVNGVGKTTTIGKLAKQFQMQGKSVMLAAGDTFRAAAVEQLRIWGDRNNIPVVSQKDGADPASVIFEAIETAKAKKIDILIADTAGRLHTDNSLMQELAKIHRVIQRLDDSAPHEVMLVVDASTGQNALNQAKQFNEVIPLSGISFTKMDGTAKGGIIFAIADTLNIPVRYIGVGEGIDDLRPFNAKDFVGALISDKKS